MRVDLGTRVPEAGPPDDEPKAEKQAAKESTGVLGRVGWLFKGAAGFAADGARKIGRAAVGTTRAVRAMASNAAAIVRILKSAAGEANDRERLVERFKEALPAIVPQVDRHADGFAIGFVAESGIGFCDAIGSEIVYVRAKGDQPARLRVSEVDGLVARLNAGVNTKAYFRCVYGEPDKILIAKKRLGTEVGAAVASVQFFRAVQPREDRPELTREELENYVAPTLATGWTGAIGSGLGVNLPIVSDAAAFNLEEKPGPTHELTAEQAAAVEALLEAAPDREMLRKLAT